MSTADIAPGDRSDYWREVICHTFIELDVTQHSGPGFRGQVHTRQFGDLSATRITCDPMVATRTRQSIEHGTGDRYLVALQLRGHTVGSQDGRTVSLEPGDLALFDSRRPYSVDFRGDAFDHLVFHMPPEAMSFDRALAGHVTARRIAGGSGVGRLVSGFLAGLHRLDIPDSDAERLRLGQVAVDLLSTSLQWSGSPDVRRPRETADLVERIKAYAGARLHDPALGPGTVAAAFSISARTVHRVFAARGESFGAWLREERLARCHEALADPALRDVTIHAVRARFGYHDAAVFSRAFRERFGISPSERRAVLGEPRQGPA